MKEKPKYNLDIIAANTEEKMPFLGKQVDLFYRWPNTIEGSTGIKNVKGVLQKTTSNFIVFLERNGTQHIILKENIVDMILLDNLVSCKSCGQYIELSEFEAFGGLCVQCDEIKNEGE